MNSVSKVKIAVGYTLLLAVLFFSLFFVHREMENLILTDDRDVQWTDSVLALIREKDTNTIRMLRTLSEANDSMVSTSDIEQIIAQKAVHHGRDSSHKLHPGSYHRCHPSFRHFRQKNRRQYSHGGAQHNSQPCTYNRSQYYVQNPVFRLRRHRLPDGTKENFFYAHLEDGRHTPNHHI